MASASGPGGFSGGGRRGKKSLDAEINLVPFIDLLSMCICFLLMTAVWIQIGAVQIKQSHGTEGAESTAASYELSLQFTGPTSIQADLKKGTHVVKKQTFTADTVEKLLPTLSAGLKSMRQATASGAAASSLRTIGGSAPMISISSAFLTPKKGVPYGTLVSVMDVMRQNQMINLGVVPPATRGED